MRDDGKLAWVGALLIAVYLAIAIGVIVLAMSSAQAEGIKPYCPDNGHPWAVVNACEVNFRDGPGKEYRVRMQWSWGVAVEVLAQCEGWYQVLHWTSPDPMWVWGEYLTFV